MYKERTSLLTEKSILKIIYKYEKKLPHISRNENEYKRIANEIMQHDAVLRIIKEDWGGLSVLLRLQPIRSSSLLLTILKLGLNCDPFSREFKEIIDIIGISIDKDFLKNKQEIKSLQEKIAEQEKNFNETLKKEIIKSIKAASTRIAKYYSTIIALILAFLLVFTFIYLIYFKYQLLDNSALISTLISLAALFGSHGGIFFLLRRFFIKSLSKRINKNMIDYTMINKK